MSENCLEEDAAGVEIDSENTAAVLWSVDAIPYPPRSRLSGAAPATTGSVCDDWKRIDFFIQRLDDNDCPDRPGGSRRSCRKSAFRRLAAASTKKNRIEKYPEVWSKPCGARQLGALAYMDVFWMHPARHGSQSIWLPARAAQRFIEPPFIFLVLNPS